MMPRRSPWELNSGNLPRLLAGLAIVAGGATVLSWILDAPGVSSLHPKLAPMHPVVAAVIVLAGVSLWLLHPADPPPWRRWTGRGFALVVVVIMLQRAGPSWWGGAPEPLASVPVFSAWTLLFVALAALLMDVETGRVRPFEYLVLAAQFVIVLAVVAWAYGALAAEALPGGPPRIAVHTLICFGALSLAIPLARPQRGWAAILTSNAPSGILARRLLPLGVAVPVAAGWLTTVLFGTAPPVLAASLTALFAATGFVVLIWWNVRSMHEVDIRRRAAERALRQSEALLSRTQSLVQLGSYDVNQATGEVLCSPELRRIYGVGEDQAVTPELMASSIHPGDRERVAERLAAAAAGAGPVHCEHRILDRSGGIRYVQCTAELVREASGELHLIGTVQDITEHRELEEKLRHAQKMEAIGELAGGLAHDFNNLLTVILGFAGLAQEQAPADSALGRSLAQVHKAGERAAALTRQLLAFGRKQRMDPQAADLSRTLAGMDAMLRRVLGPGIEIRSMIEPGLGLTLVDRNQFEQAVLNLALNARDAMPGGGRLTLELKNEDVDIEDAEPRQIPPGRYVTMAVSDTGTGMTPEVKERIFEPFFTTKEQGKGTGLGLAVTHGIVVQSGGYIACYSEPGVGTTFRILLPRAAAAGTAEREAPVAAAGGVETILVVDDEPAVRRLVCAALGGAGYRVLEAAGLEEAQACSRDHPGEIDLLVSDVALPRTSGQQIAESIGAGRSGIRVLFISGYTKDAMEHQGKLRGGWAFLPKPFTPVRLLAKVREVLDGPPI